MGGDAVCPKVEPIGSVWEKPVGGVEGEGGQGQ